MSLNVSGSKYVRVYDRTINFDYSDKVMIANLVSSRKTGSSKVDKETGEILINQATGKEISERAFSRWKARFVGNAFEPSKGLRSGDAINILTGWITNESFKGTDNKEHYALWVNISEFELSDIQDNEEADVESEE